jgi:cytochrome c oxidase assembly protein subunit 15
VKTLEATTVPSPPAPRWLHGWAVLTVVAALPLVTLGAEVTTKQVGMVDPQGFRAPWHLLTAPLRERGLGYLIEHSHRLAGFVVGTCSIVLALGLWFGARRPPVRWLGWLALAAVSLQGVLGIFRVDLHQLVGPSLALIHGCFAQLVFALLVGVAVVTSRAWAQAPVAAHAAPGLRRLSLVVGVMAFVQIVFGALVRHFHTPAAQRAHVLFAFAVVAVLVWLLRGVWERPAAEQAPRRLAGLLAGLLAVQLALGVEAWVRRFGSGILPELQPSSFSLDLVRSGHFVVGTLLFATTVALALLLHRPAMPTAAFRAVPAGPLEGAA